MSTLLLISHGKFLERDLAPLLGRPLKDLKVIHITTAVKGTKTDMTPFWQIVHSALEKQGCLVEDLDIEGKNKEGLRQILKEANIVFVNGGSTFYLLRAILESGLNQVLKELLPQGLIYMGASAGAYVACPTIEVTNWKNKDKNNFGITDLTAMNLVPFILFVHYVPENREMIKEKIAQANYPTRILTDDQAILVKDDRIEFLGGEEIKL
ncbi:MAG: Type 1 glutamine amidotransferase-like domain-containing protein [Patescibacteria group bacterium]